MRVFRNRRKNAISSRMDIASTPSGPGRQNRRLPNSMLALQNALGGRYVLERELGKGGMGVVYLAWETALGRWVALKILPPALANERRRERFLREARIAARLKHDHIVPIYAVDEAGPFVYYTMEYVRGASLAHRIVAEGPLPVAEVTRLLHDVALAVHYAHDLGVVHRDLKPLNILIEQKTGRAYVADFGIARVFAGAMLPGGGGADGGGAGRTIGTFAYASPEQAAGYPADHRSDIYSLGVVAYVAATGQPLFVGSPREILKHHISTPAPRLGVLNRHLDPTLARAVARCLVKDPAERYQTAGELASALSLAPEIRSDLPPPLGGFVAGLEQQSRSAPAGIALALADMAVLAWALESGHWGTAAGALGFMGLIVASPVFGALPAMRRLLRQGYGAGDIVHALKTDLDRQRQRLASRWGSATENTSKITRRVLASALGLFGLGTLTAVSGLDLPGGVVLGSLVGGAFTTVAAGAVLVRRERRRNELKGVRWLRLFEGRLGKWAVKLAGVGLGALPSEPELPPLPPAAAPTLPADRPATAKGEPTALGKRGGASELSELSEVSQLEDATALAEWCIRRIRAYVASSSAARTREGGTPTPEELESERTLEEQAALLETLLQRFLEAEAEAEAAPNLAADLAAAREVCLAVEWLIEGREFAAGWTPGAGSADAGSMG